MNTAKNDNFVKDSPEYRSKISTKCVNKINRPVRCHLCCRDFSTKDHYDYHVKKYHRVTKECIASKRHDSVINLNPAIDGNIRNSSIWKGFDLKCDQLEYSVCHVVNANVTELAEHEKTHNSSSKNYISCETVSTFMNNDYNAIVNHYSNNVLPWWYPVEEHIKAIHEFKLDVHEFNCGFCKKSCLNPVHFEIHQWWSKDVCKPFECNMCFQNFKKRSQLKKHKIKHFEN